MPSKIYLILRSAAGRQAGRASRPACAKPKRLRFGGGRRTQDADAAPSKAPPMRRLGIALPQRGFSCPRRRTILAAPPAGGGTGETMQGTHGLAILIAALLWLGPAAAQGDAPDAPYLLVDAATGAVLAERNATQPWYPASVTKIGRAHV